MFTMRTWAAGSSLLPVWPHHTKSGHRLGMPEHTPWSSVHQSKKTSNPVGMHMPTKDPYSLTGFQRSPFITEAQQAPQQGSECECEWLPAGQSRLPSSPQSNPFYTAPLLQSPDKRSFANVTLAQRRTDLYGDMKVRQIRITWWTLCDCAFQALMLLNIPTGGLCCSSLTLWFLSVAVWGEKDPLSIFSIYSFAPFLFFNYLA